MITLKIPSTRSPLKKGLKFIYYKQLNVPNGNTIIFALNIFGLNVCVHPWIHSADEISVPAEISIPAGGGKIYFTSKKRTVCGLNEFRIDSRVSI